MFLQKTFIFFLKKPDFRPARQGGTPPPPWMFIVFLVTQENQEVREPPVHQEPLAPQKCAAYAVPVVQFWAVSKKRFLS